MDLSCRWHRWPAPLRGPPISGNVTGSIAVGKVRRLVAGGSALGSYPFGTIRPTVRGCHGQRSSNRRTSATVTALIRSSSSSSVVCSRR